MARIITTFVAFFLAVFISGQSVLADGEAGQGHANKAHKIVLTAYYADGSGRDPVQLTMPDLRKLPHAGFETTTIWTEGLQRFDGVWLKDLAAHLGMDEGRLEMSALNEYLIDITVAELEDSAALVTYLRNGEPMTAREKGPLWVVFPYDSDPKFRTETVFARSIWQLDRITLLPSE